MAEEQMVNATRNDVDDAVFGAAEVVADTMNVSRRERLQLTLQIAEAVMHNIDLLSDAAKRSEAGKKAAAARYANKGDPRKQANVPTPGPAIPPPEPQKAMDVTQGNPPPAQQPSAPLPPPPHPALMPQGVPSAPQPFGAPPA